MTEKSYFWEREPNNLITGDSEASYDSDVYQLFMSLCLSIDRTVQGPVNSFYNPFLGSTLSENLLPEASGTDIIINPGIAICDGAFYANTADVTFDCSAVEYHRVVLRTSRSGGTDQTTRLALLSNAGAYVALTQNANTWEISIARAISNGAALTTFIDDRIFINNNIIMRARRAASTPTGGIGIGSLENDQSWVDAAISTDLSSFPIGPTMIKVGVTGTPTANFSVIFDEPFSRKPFVFVTPFNYTGGTPNYATVIYLSEITRSGFIISTPSVTDIAGYNWFAIGPMYLVAV